MVGCFTNFLIFSLINITLSHNQIPKSYDIFKSLKFEEKKIIKILVAVAANTKVSIMILISVVANTKLVVRKKSLAATNVICC